MKNNLESLRKVNYWCLVAPDTYLFNSELNKYCADKGKDQMEESAMILQFFHNELIRTYYNIASSFKIPF